MSARRQATAARSRLTLARAPPTIAAASRAHDRSSCDHAFFRCFPLRSRPSSSACATPAPPPAPPQSRRLRLPPPDRRRRRPSPTASAGGAEPASASLAVARARAAAAAGGRSLGPHPPRLRDAGSSTTRWSPSGSNGTPTRPDYVARMIDRSRRYLYYIVVEVEKRGMPLEIALLPMVESAFNPNAVSVARASGIWQFMPATGTHYGLKQNFWFDSRRDVVAATDSALDYLQKLHGDFDDWQLALAGYNWGEGNVARAVAQEPEARACPPTMRISRCRTRRATTCRSCRRSRTSFAIRRSIRARSHRHPGRARISPSSRWTARSTSRLRPSWPRCRSTSSCTSIRSTTARSSPAPTNTRSCCRSTRPSSLPPSCSSRTSRWCRGRRIACRNGETLAQVAAKFGLEVEALRAVNGIGAKAKSARRTHAARADAGADRRGRGDAVEGRFHHRTAGPHVLLPRPARRHARRHRRPATRCPRRTSSAGTTSRRIRLRRERRCASRAISRRPPARRSARRARAEDRDHRQGVRQDDHEARSGEEGRPGREGQDRRRRLAWMFRKCNFTC